MWINAQHVIVPVIFKKSVITGNIYVDMLELLVFLKLNEQVTEMPLDIHCSLSVRFPNRWIGKAGPVPLPSRNPDLTSPLFHVGLF